MRTDMDESGRELAGHLALLRETLKPEAHHLVERLRAYVESTDYMNAEGLCAEAADQLERWEAYRAELADMEQRLGKLARNFLDCGAWADAAKCALKAEGMGWIRGRMPPEA